MKVCKNCGCPPPKNGEPGIYCSACGAEVVYINSETGASMPRVTLFNTSIVTAYGSYRYEPLSLQDAREIALTNSAESAIGHQATADILTELFGFKVVVNRSNNQQQPGDIAIVFKLRGRPEEGKVLNREEVEAIGYDFGLLTRTE
jgi:hypothetical protein